MTSRRAQFRTLCLGLLTLAVAVGCGGGGGGGTSPTPATVSQTTVQASAPGTVTLTLSIPLSASSSSTSRSAKAVPAGSEGIVVYAYPASASTPATPTTQCNSGGGGYGCLGDLTLPPPSLPANNIQLCQPSGGSKVCTISVIAPPGNDVFIVQLFDTEPTCTGPGSCTLSAAANLLASGATTATISDNASNSVSIVLGAGTYGAVTTGTWTPAAQAATTSSTISGGSLVFSLPAGSVPAPPPAAQVGISTILQLVLPLSSARRPEATSKGGGAGAGSDPQPGNLLVYGLDFSLLGPSTLLQALVLTGTNFDVSGTLAASLDAPGAIYLLNIAMVSNGTYVDVGNLTYSYANDVLTITGGSSGILQSGLYVLYLAPQSSVTLPIHVPPGQPSSMPSGDP